MFSNFNHLILIFKNTFKLLFNEYQILIYANKNIYLVNKLLLT